MIEQTNKKEKRINSAFVEGWLRESKLRTDLDKNGSPYIGGSVVVAVDRFNSQRVSVYIPSKSGKRGAEHDNPDYSAALPLLQAATMEDVASNIGVSGGLDNYDNPDDKNQESTWQKIANQASKVWFKGSYEEYYTLSLEDKNHPEEHSSYIFHARRGAIFNGGKNPFTPRDTLALDGLVQKSMYDEESNRLKLILLWINYKGEAQKFNLVASNRQVSVGTSIADRVQDSFPTNSTAKFNISIHNVVTHTVKADDGGWGTQLVPTTTTTFGTELEIIGGRAAKGIMPDESTFAITPDEIKEALLARRKAGVDNEERAKARRENKAASTAAKSVAKGFVDSFDNADSTTNDNDGSSTTPSSLDF